MAVRTLVILRHGGVSSNSWDLDNPNAPTQRSVLRINRDIMGRIRVSYEDGFTRDEIIRALDYIRQGRSAAEDPLAMFEKLGRAGLAMIVIRALLVYPFTPLSAAKHMYGMLFKEDWSRRLLPERNQLRMDLAAWVLEGQP